MTDFIEKIVAQLAAGGIDSPKLEVRFMAAYVLKIDSNALPFCPTFSKEQQQEMLTLVEKRLARFPLDKLLGEKGFYKYDFTVSEAVLSPRPDTETLVEAAIAAAKKMDSPKILDLGTGSGCIILSILGDVQPAFGTAVDISAAALDVAKTNAQRLKLDSRLKFVHGSWFYADLADKITPPFDIIVSNPPYIPKKDIEDLEPEVREHDPLTALDGGEDGFDHYRQIALVSGSFLRPGGLIFLEGGINQEKMIAEIFINKGFQLVDILADLSGINRCVILKK